MKYLKFIIIAALSSVSCNQELNDPLQPSIIGRWEWVSSSGGIAGVTYTPATQGHTETIEFDATGNYFKFLADTLNSTTSFTLKTGNSIFSSEDVDLIEYKDGSIQQVIFSIKNDTLSLGDNCFDCFGHTYVRIK